MDWPVAIGTGTEARIRPTPGKLGNKDAVWLASSQVIVADQVPVQFLGAGTGPLKVWLNGQQVLERKDARAFVPDAERFDATLVKGTNRIVMQVSPVKGQAEFHLRFRRKSSAADHEQLIQAALSRPGNAERGRNLFFDVAKTQCLKCHRLGEQGERIGPDLTGVGSRFARVYLIESILEPSRTIAPSYETLHVHLKDGRALSGVKIDGDRRRPDPGRQPRATSTPSRNPTLTTAALGHQHHAGRARASVDYGGVRGFDCVSERSAVKAVSTSVWGQSVRRRNS